MNPFKQILSVGMIGCAALGPAVASADQSLAKQAQNPVADLISLPLQNNTNFGLGPDDRTQNILNVQPVWPIELNDDWNLITRTILPVVSQPLPDGDRKNGLGDISFTAFLSPSAESKVTWGVGPGEAISAPPGRHASESGGLA